MSARAVHVPSIDAPPLAREAYRMPLSDALGAVAILVQPEPGTRGGGIAAGAAGTPPPLGDHLAETSVRPPPPLGDHLRRGLDSTAPLLPPMMRELELLVIGQPVTLAPSFGADGGGISCTAAATLPAESERQMRADASASSDDDGSSEGSSEVPTRGRSVPTRRRSAPPASGSPSATALTSGPHGAAAGVQACALLASALAPSRAKSSTASPPAGKLGRTRPYRTRPRRGGAVVVAPGRALRRSRRASPLGQRVSVYAAVRLLLPRKLQAQVRRSFAALPPSHPLTLSPSHPLTLFPTLIPSTSPSPQVGRSLDTLDLKAALAELRSYRDPPKVVLQVVAAVVCLLSLSRLPGGRLPPWSQLRGHLKSSLTRRMLDFDAADAAADESAWAESAAASDGLTSDDVWRKGSLAVQMMLRWLEVTRLTRREAAAARDASV